MERKGGRKEEKKEIFFPLIYFLFLLDIYVGALNLGKLINLKSVVHSI